MKSGPLGGCLIALSLLCCAVAADQIETDLRALTRAPHRLSGSDNAKDAAAYIESQLRATGIERVLEVDFPLTWPVAERCQLTAAGETIDLLPLRPDLLVPPATPTGGLSGPLLYAGRGTAAEYGERQVDQAIVALEYDCEDNWRLAFALGAKAVIFLGGELDLALTSRALGLPANTVRLYAPPAAQAQFDLRRDRDRVTVVSQVRWRLGTGRSIAAYIKGREAALDADLGKEEVLVIGAHFDSYGEVPWASPGAHGAANCALLLDLARRLDVDPPRRDVLLVFFDGHGRFHEGARWLYSGLLMRADEDADLRAGHDREMAELTQRQQQLSELTANGVDGEQDLVLLRYLKRFAKQRRGDERERAAASRRRGDDSEIAAAKTRMHMWDTVLRSLARNDLSEASPEAVAEMLADAAAHTATRLAEVEQLQQIDGQRAELRTLLSERWIALHLTLDLSDGGDRWSVVVGDDSLATFKQGSRNADGPGFYTRILAACREAAESADPKFLHRDSLVDPRLGQQLVPVAFSHDGRVAGTFGIYNLALMSGADRRQRHGHPADSVANLDLPRMLRLYEDARPLLRALADGNGLSLPRVFPPQSKTDHPSWSSARAWGHFVSLRQTGGLDEDRPASGATVALWPALSGERRYGGPATRLVADIECIVMTRADANGRFPLVGVRKDHFGLPNVLGLLQSASGEVSWISNQETLQQRDANAFRTDLFPAAGGVSLTALGVHPKAVPNGLRVLNAASDAGFHDGRVLQGADGGAFFYYLRRTDALSRLKLFQANGVVALGVDPETKLAVGLPLSEFATPARLDDNSVSDLWQLNENRLNILRSRGVSRLDLEELHSAAEYAMSAAADQAEVSQRRELARSLALSRHVYQPLRQVMDDLVYAIIVLLLLSIPFAFAMERLLICATTVYGRLAGFAGFFLTTLAVLYALHPGFAVAATPVIVFLAFVIILLSGMVIYIVVRKFESELEGMRGQAAAAHSAEVSRMGTLLAAVGMGMSTMRRRPVRTFLTAITVTILSFTILCFASVSSRLGVRSIYEGAIERETAPDALVRDVAYTSLDEQTVALMIAAEPDLAAVAEHWWLVSKTGESERISLSRADYQKDAWLDGMLSVAATELRHWPELAAIFSVPVDAAVKGLADGDIFISAAVAESLSLQPGDSCIIHGRPSRVGGTFAAPALQRLKHLDGGKLLPIDLQQLANTGGADDVTDAAQLARLSPDQVVVASPAQVRAFGGELYQVSLYGGPGSSPLAIGERLAQLTQTPVWVRASEGARRLVFTNLTEVRGVYDLIVPLLLGALIIFGTMLGSISDREREIYTFSALGLAPAHVGFLFFAEAAVYAVVGGMSGQLLAQIVGHAAAWLADLGAIKAVAINFSSTNSLFAIAAVMLTVLLSAVYPAMRAGRSANPGLQRTWQLPAPDGDLLKLRFPFTMSAYDATGVMSFLAEHFEEHQDAGLGIFAAQDIEVARQTTSEALQLRARLVLAPFDLGVTQSFQLRTTPSAISGVEEIELQIQRLSGTGGDWRRANAVLMKDLRRQFLLWRTLSREAMEGYRARTLTVLGRSAATPSDQSGAGHGN